MAAEEPLHRSGTLPRDSLTGASWLLFGAPLAAILAGMAAEWLDFRTLRYPLLLMVGAGVLSTAWALFGVERTLRAFFATVLLGAATWVAAETLYVVLHAVQGERFDMEPSVPQWAQALELIGIHGLVLGVPTGGAVAVIRHLLARTFG